MDKYNISRRQVLVGLAGTGSVGALAGSGTAALFADEEGPEDELFSVGKLDLEVDWVTDRDMTGSSAGDVPIPIEVTREQMEGSATLTVSLPGSRNIPAYGWFRVTCPDPAGTTLAEKLEATLAYKGNDEYLVGPDGEPLGEFAKGLNGGFPLSPDDDASVSFGEQDCLEPEGEIELVFDWEVHLDDGGYAGDESVSIIFEFVGRQCRNRTASNPFREAHACDDTGGGVDS